MLPRSLRIAALLALSCSSLTSPSIAAADPAPSVVKMLIPGFSVQELPLTLTNQNNVEYTPDGRLFSAGYDGRVHMLKDTDGDGLEDKVITLWDKTSGDFPLGITFHEKALYIVYRSEIVRFTDPDGDGVPDRREVILSDWDKTNIIKAPLILTARMDFANGLAIGPDGYFYVAMGSAAFQNPYRRDPSGKIHYKTSDLRGCLLRIAPDGSTVEQIATGLRYVVSIQFNRLGDLFLTDQEGATWVPNGNPFDELLHIQPGRHYGFPSRHPRYLPEVHDEPSVFDYAPQHQSICGFRFNESIPGRARFGPPEWEGDAILTGESRGKLYRTKLVKTENGYVAQTQLFAAIQGLPVDCTLSPQGELLVAIHTGPPDWGTGPQGIGRIFKLRYIGGSAPLPLFTHAAAPGVAEIVFDGPLPASYENNLKDQINARVGRFVDASNLYERNPPPYAIVKAQRTEKTTHPEVQAVTLSPDRRTLRIQTGAGPEALVQGLSLPEIPSSHPSASGAHVIVQSPGVEVAHDLTGVSAVWRPYSSSGKSSQAQWKGWLPHLNLSVNRSFTQSSTSHDKLFQLLQENGTLSIQGQLNLAYMLRPEIQPGSTIDFIYEPETVTLVLTSNQPVELKVTQGKAKLSRADARTVLLTVDHPQHNDWLPFELQMTTTSGTTPQLDVHWFTAEDARPRALPLRRLLVPWAKPAPAITETREIPQIAGGNWERGKALYFGQAACAVCHTIRGEGAHFGPDLTNSVHRDYDAILSDITAPSASINPDRIGYRVEQNDGTITAGIVTEDTPSHLTLLNAAGQKTTLAKTTIRTTEPMKQSLMPEGLLASLSQDEIRDLMTFLLKEKR
ncbi:MAG TPA: c-type cytochrome [Opitutaceae bacterium]|nr:c-type cytochrome [Opitutaceae bacterium]